MSDILATKLSAIETLRPQGEANLMAHARGDRKKMEQGVSDFQGILLSQCIQKMQETFASPGEVSDPAGESFSGMGAQALGAALARNDALGIRKMLLHGLEAAQPAESKASEPAPT